MNRHSRRKDGSVQPTSPFAYVLSYLKAISLSSLRTSVTMRSTKHGLLFLFYLEFNERLQPDATSQLVQPNPWHFMPREWPSSKKSNFFPIINQAQAEFRSRFRKCEICQTKAWNISLEIYAILIQLARLLAIKPRSELIWKEGLKDQIISRSI